MALMFTHPNRNDCQGSFWEVKRKTYNLSAICERMVLKL
jgi:hypothetical protein